MTVISAIGNVLLDMGTITAQEAGESLEVASRYLMQIDLSTWLLYISTNSTIFFLRIFDFFSSPLVCAIARANSNFSSWCPPSKKDNFFLYAASISFV